MRIRWVCALVIAPLFAPAASAGPDEAGTPDARAVYEGMLRTIEGAESLSYVCKKQAEYETGKPFIEHVWAAWLEKPNRARFETIRGGRTTGVLTIDGEHLRIHWPAGRPRYQWEREGELGRVWEETKDRCYLVKPAAGGHSIAHEMGKLDVGMQMSIFEPSLFHGSFDPLRRYLDGAKHLGVEQVGGEECDVVEIAYMRGQRVRRIWVARKDHLPRMFFQILKGARTYYDRETWSEVALDADIPDEKFTWKPPEGWVEWSIPKPEDGLLDVGAPAPDFDLPLSGGGRFRLSEARGKVVWLYIWRSG